jgi:hypothetical protein
MFDVTTPHTGSHLGHSALPEKAITERALSQIHSWDLQDWDSIPEPSDYSSNEPSTTVILGSPANEPIMAQHSIKLPDPDMPEILIPERQSHEFLCPNCFLIKHAILSQNMSSGLCTDCDPTD